ncbi:phosphoglycerate kinase [Candidatus Woesearchaeota archaeon]|nr:phosphoglycerate kinase [Candidatus Woesearchaeota archaeon]
MGLCGKKIESDPGITSKITVVRGLLDKMRSNDALLIGGAVTYTFILAQHYASRIKGNLDNVNKIVGKYDSRIVSEVKSMKDKEQAAKAAEKLQKQKSDELKALLGIEDKEIKKLVGDSYIRWGQEGEQFVYAYNVLSEAEARGIAVVIGYDHVIANKLPDKSGTLPEGAEIRVHKSPINIPEGWLGVAEGPKTLREMAKKIENAGIYLQSGPFSIEDEGVEAISKTDHAVFNAVSKCKSNGGITIGAGGDTVARIHRLNAENAFSIMTSAGGATLELIETGTSKGKGAVEEAQRMRKM